NDPYYGSAWYFDAVNAPSAWNTTTGSSSVTVAVIDTGFALAHQDLAAHWHYNSGEQGGGKDTNGVDDDGNGYIDDYLGWDFVPYTYVNDPGDNNPQAGVDDPNGEGTSHGTETSGLVGAVGDNGIGTTAISRDVSVMPLQVIDDSGSGYSDDVAEAIYYAVDNGADVINMSLGTSGNDPTVEAAVEYAYDNNVVVVAAAGNCGNPGSDGPCTGQVTGYITFPANNDKVIAVGATTSSNARASFSSYGERLDIVAPGSGSIVSPTWVNGNGTSAYATQLYGTSYASPITASTAALIKSVRPSSSVDDVRALLMASTQQLGGLFYTTSYGHGLLNVSKAVTIAGALNSDEDTPVLAQSGTVRGGGLYAGSDTISSGCEVGVSTWCTVWLRNASAHYERYLPYTDVGGDGKAGWHFSSAALNHGEWEVRARQGELVSDTPYFFFRK
ncbi:S8 family serine peptidase, partial [Candidatus Saccharibacteria bacterium]|nr:S8 family serine peptidase [Candidatus Saccharibacteria bacterium]